MPERLMKDSGIQWIGKIPIDWVLGKTKNRFINVKEIAGKEADNIQRLALTLNGVIKRSKDENAGLQPEQFETYQILRENELVFKLIDLENVSTSRVGRNPFEIGIVSPAYIVLRNKQRYSTKYAEYWFLSMWMNEVFNHLGGDGVRSSLGAKDLLQIPFPIISIEEQDAIASFLDEKCEKIDTAIEEAKKSILEYVDYKKTLITKCVTKGLNKNCEFKESGNLFVGKYPAHWEVTKVRRITKEHLQGYYDSAGYIDEGYRLLRITDLKGDGMLCVSNSPFVRKKEEAEPFLVKKGDFCFARTGGAGNFGFVSKEIEPTVFASYLIRFRFKNQFNPFLKYYFLSYAFINEINSLIHGSVNQNVHAENIKDTSITVPPREEQEAIADFLDEKCEKIDAIISEKEELIIDLEAYKKSLIYECVTGKREVIKS